MNPINLHSKETRKLKLNQIVTIGHYSFALAPLMIPGMELYFKLNHIQNIHSFSNTTLLICFILSGIIIYLKRKELIIERIYRSRTDEEFNDAVLATANKLNWIIKDLSDYEMVATAPNSWRSRSWSDIKINRQHNYVEVSSTFDPFLSLPDFFGSNKKNRQTFLHNYLLSNQGSSLNEKVIKQLNEEKERFENEPEWSFKNSLKRIVIYLFIFILLAVCVIILLNGFNFIVIPIGVLCLGYLIMDWMTIIKKMRRKVQS